VGVVCCYSMIQSGSVPFVLRFVQQALHLLWSGLDKVQPHESVGQEMWQDVGPADLGEMAADVEMQHHFVGKKRRHDSISELRESFAAEPDPENFEPLSAQLKHMDFQREDRQESAQSDSRQKFSELKEEDDIVEVYTIPRQQQSHAMQAFQNHIKEALRQVGEAVPFSHSHKFTTADGSKRAHVGPHEHRDHNHAPQQSQPVAPQPLRQPRPMRKAAPLAMPNALPTHVVKSSHRNHQGAPAVKIDIQNLSPQLLSSTSSQITKNLAGGRMQPQTHYPSQPPERNFTAQQPHVQQNFAPQGGMSAHNNNTNNAPSQLNQNMMGQPMPTGLQSSLFNGQQYHAVSETLPDQTQNHMYQQQSDAMKFGNSMEYAGNYDDPSFWHQANTVAPPPAPASNSMEPQQPTMPNNGYCMPATSPYPTPDPVTTTSMPQGAPAAAHAINGKFKPCRIQGCDEPCVARRPYCVRHSGNRLCEHEGCNKCAQGSTRFCIAHGGGRRCTFPGCDKGARDKFFCAAHGGGKRCKFEGCNKSAVGGSSLCTAHGGGRRCAVEGCDKSAQSSTKFCVKHGGGKKCAHEGCEKVARGRTQYCAAVSLHASDFGAGQLRKREEFSYTCFFFLWRSMVAVYAASWKAVIV
jgi:hypothetical protein